MIDTGIKSVVGNLIGAEIRWMKKQEKQ
jgi:hypothetical protein